MDRLHHPRILLAMTPDIAPRLFDSRARTRLAAIADVDPDFVVDDFTVPDAAEALAETEVLLTCWGAPVLDATVLASAPRLRAVVHAAGSLRRHITEACWRRDLQITSAAWANALPVAEYTVAMIIVANKRLLRVRDLYRRHRGTRLDLHQLYTGAGNYDQTVGIVGASRIGRRVLELLRPYDLRVLLYDPYSTPAYAESLGAKLVGLDELCQRSDVVTIHAPQLRDTEHLIDAARLAMLPDGATLINTARGTLVDQDALVAELATGRIDAIIDVTDPDVLPADSPLYNMPNVFLTPHVAGSLGTELHRLGAAAIEEIQRYAAGLPFAHAIKREDMERTA
ncbi:MAG TPA: hydroxyacid dehydrogenase [Pseudonocardiaceae bacterium]